MRSNPHQGARNGQIADVIDPLTVGLLDRRRHLLVAVALRRRRRRVTIRARRRSAAGSFR